VPDSSAQPRAPDVKPLGDGRYLVSDGSRQSIAWGAGAPESTWVFLDGRVYIVNTAETGRAAGRAHADDLVLAAPMPATVAAINVAPGQQVSTGDVMIVLEAMKMELPIRAPRDGRVKRIACERGELVQPGIPLVELE
jgi:acetyl/propionyl-CoA carboxylase alpha subunit